MDLENLVLNEKEIRILYLTLLKTSNYIDPNNLTEPLIAEARGKIANDFRVFFMGHKGNMEARYTTNKGILPDALTQEMSEAFHRCEEFLDLDVANQDPILEQKHQMQTAIQNATPEQLDSMLEMLQSIGKMSPNSA